MSNKTKSRKVVRGKVAAKRPAKPAGKSSRRSSSNKAAPPTRGGTKQSALISHLRRRGGATIAELQRVTGWQAHSVRGAISGTLKKKLGLAVASEVVEGRGRVYRVAADV